VTHFTLPEYQIAQFQENGFIIVEGIFDPEEIDLVRQIAHLDKGLMRITRRARDSAGKTVRMWIRDRLGDDVFSTIVRCRRVVGAMTQLLGDEVYHWHHKMTMKNPGDGAWEWHQDYGYWYHYGCLLPEIATCLIAVDEATKENGCLQVIRGSHKMGRLETRRHADQNVIADDARLVAVLARMVVIDCELKKGDALFLHCNTLHRSDPNTSCEPRWAFLATYNTARNDPYAQPLNHQHDPDAPPAHYKHLQTLADDQVLAVGKRQLALL